MKTQFFHIEESVGKTICAAEEDAAAAFFVFTDNTFLYLKVGGEGGDYLYSDFVVETDDDPMVLSRLGILSDSEAYAALEKKRAAEAAQQAQIERRERSEYLRLKQKFEKGGDGMDNSTLSPEDVIAMPLAEFERRFGFRPTDALEKRWFAINAKRISSVERQYVAAGLVGDVDLSQVVME